MTRRGNLRRLWWPATAAAFTAAALVMLWAAANVPSGETSTPAETLTGGALLLFAGAGLTVVLWLRSRGGGGSRRKPTHAGAAASGSDQAGGSSTPGASGARQGADGPDPGDGERSSLAPSAEASDWPYPDHPSWPAGSTGRPLTPDHPSWPAGGLHRPIGYGRPGGTVSDFPYGDHPSWPAGGIDRPVASDDSSWPAAGPGGPRAAGAGGQPADDGPAGPRRERVREPLPPATHRNQHPGPAAPHVPPARGRHVRVPAGYSGYPRPGVPARGDKPQRWSARLARNPGPIPQTYYDLAFGDGRLQVVLTETQDRDPGRASPGGRSGQMLQLPGPGTAGGPVPGDTEEYGNVGPVRVAERVLADADQQAAAIRQEAASQAVAIRESAEREAAETRRQAAAEAAPVREAAVREAAEIKDQAAAQVAAIREAAEREIGELRATVLAMSDELRRVAEHVTESLISPGQPAVPPPRRAGPSPSATPAQPDAEPSAEPTGSPAGRPGAGPAVKRQARPRAEPAGRPGTSATGKPRASATGKPGTSAKGRQVRAMHKMVAAFVTVSVVGVVAGAAEIALHGFPFFAFRANGAGASLTGLKEDQGPGQPDAPQTHRKAPAATPGATAQARHSGAKSNGKKSHGAQPKNAQPHGTQPQGKQAHGKQRHGNQPTGQQSPKPGKSG